MRPSLPAPAAFGPKWAGRVGSSASRRVVGTNRFATWRGSFENRLD